MDESVKKEVCDLKHQYVDERVSRTEDAIVEIKQAVATLTEIVKSMKPKPTFWASPNGSFIIKVACIAGLMIIAAAIGMGYKEALTAALGK